MFIMKNNNENLRLRHSLLISFSAHFLLFLICAISIAVYASNNSSETPVIRVNYQSQQVLVYDLSGSNNVSACDHDKDIELPKETNDQKREENDSRYEEAQPVSTQSKIDLSEFIKEKKIEQEKKDEYEISTNVQNSSIKYVQQEEKSEETDFNSEKFHTSSIKLLWDGGSNLKELEEIKNYFSEIHMVRFIPTRNAALIIDSYLNKQHHILYDPTREDFLMYPLQAKSILVRDFPKLYSCIKEMVKSENCDIKNYSEIYILVPKYHWTQILSSCNIFLSKYKLTLSDDKVKHVSIEYVKQNSDFVIRVRYIEIEKDGKIIRIDN